MGAGQGWSECKGGGEGRGVRASDEGEGTSGGRQWVDGGRLQGAWVGARGAADVSRVVERPLVRVRVRLGLGLG